MSTKGASNRYPTGKRSSTGKTASHINFEWARGFSKNSLDIHFNEHGKNMGFENKESYRQHAIKFSNIIDKKKCVSFIDAKTGATYKYNKVSNEFAIITKDGIVITYFKPKEGYSYYKNQVSKHGKKKGGNKR